MENTYSSTIYSKDPSQISFELRILLMCHKIIKMLKQKRMEKNDGQSFIVEKIPSRNKLRHSIFKSMSVSDANKWEMFRVFFYL